MRFGMLGPLQVLRGAQVLDLGRQRQRVLLARLLVDANRPVSIAGLVDDVWDGRPPHGQSRRCRPMCRGSARVLEPDRPPRRPPLCWSPNADRLTAHAFHRLQALPLGDPALAARVAFDAAEQADRRLAFHEAARWRQGALTAIAADPELAGDLRHVLQVRVALAVSLADAGERERALETLATVIDDADRLGDVDTMAEAAIAFQRAGGSWYWMAHGTLPAHLIARTGSAS